MGILYLVATPIGNLEDISLRALRVLGEVSLIAAEDTRHSRKLLDHYQINKPVTSYFEHNKLHKLDLILSVLANGDVALISDAGSPALNDPGYELVRAAIAAGFQVRSIPGPSAVIAALTISGLPTDAFLYLGYLPRKAGERRRLLGQVADLPYTLIFLESPHRLLNSIADLWHELGNRQITIAREMTKHFEEIQRSSLKEAWEYYSVQSPRGEFTLVVAGCESGVEIWDEARMKESIVQGLQAGEAPAQLASRLAQIAGWPRRQIYNLILKHRQTD